MCGGPSPRFHIGKRRSSDGSDAPRQAARLGPHRPGEGRRADDDTRPYLLEDGFHPTIRWSGSDQSLKSLRSLKRTGLSQDAFARAIGVPAGTVRNWEQGRKLPDPPAGALLTLVADPDRAFKVLAGDARWSG